MERDIFTFGRQAQLGKFLIAKRDETVSSLESGLDYFKAASSMSLNTEQKKFHYIAYLGASYSIFESYLLDIAEEILQCFPNKTKNSDVKFHDCLRGRGILISEMVEKQTGQLGYKNFNDITNTVAGYFGNSTFADPSREIVQELKATRDLYFHNSGYWNQTYARKAGPKARDEPKNNNPLSLDENYLEDGVRALIEFVKKFHQHGPRQMERYNKTKAFSEMWQASALEKLITFRDAWETEKDDMIRSKGTIESYGWSGSEKYLVDFFMVIFGGVSSSFVTSDIRQALYRWPPETPSGQVILSWLEAPFSF